MTKERERRKKKIVPKMVKAHSTILTDNLKGEKNILEITSTISHFKRKFEPKKKKKQ